MSKTFKEYEKENTIICPNCHIQIKTNFIPMSIFDNIHEDMYISHEDEYLERKALQQRINKAIEYINKEEKIYEINKSSTQLGCIDFIVNTNDFKNRIIDILRGDNIVNAEDNEKVKFWLEGCDIQFLAQAPEDITLKQLLKQCNRIIPDWCSCGINNKDIRDYQEVEIDIDYDDIKKMSEDVSCTIEEIDDNE